MKYKRALCRSESESESVVLTKGPSKKVKSSLIKLAALSTLMRAEEENKLSALRREPPLRQKEDLFALFSFPPAGALFDMRFVSAPGESSGALITDSKEQHFYSVFI